PVFGISITARVNKLLEFRIGHFEPVEEEIWLRLQFGSVPLGLSRYEHHALGLRNKRNIHTAQSWAHRSQFDRWKARPFRSEMQERNRNLSILDRRHTDFAPGRAGIAVVAVRNPSARWRGGEVEPRQYLLRKLLKVLVVRSVPEGGGREFVRRDSLI